MIYMIGVKAKDLVAIVEFIYHGEANIFQEDLDGFLALADELQLKGLATSENKPYDDLKNSIKIRQEQYDNIQVVPKKKPSQANSFGALLCAPTILEFCVKKGGR